MELLVVGAGDMGRWFAESVADPLGWSIAFTDVDPDAAARAAEAVGGCAVDVEATERFDVACFAVPAEVIESSLADHADQVERAVVDVAGAMGTPVGAMAKHVADCERVSLHPLFAPANEPGNVAVVADEPGPVTDAVRETLEARGNDLFETTVKEHDEALETVQARTHAAIVAFGLAAEEVPEQFHTPVSTALFELVEQVTGGTPHVYAVIQELYDGADDVAAAAERIAEADFEEFEELYREAGE